MICSKSLLQIGKGNKSIIIQNLLASYFTDRDNIGLPPCCREVTGFQTIPKYYRENPFEAYRLEFKLQLFLRLIAYQSLF